MSRTKLSNKFGTNIDPIMSLRTSIVVPKDSEKEIYYVNGYGKSKEQIYEIINAYNTSSKIRTAFDYSTLSNNINTKELNISGPDMRRFNIMLNYFYQTSRHFINPERKDILTKNSMNQTKLSAGSSGGLNSFFGLILVEQSE